MRCGSQCCGNEEYCADTRLGVCCGDKTVLTKNGCCLQNQLCGNSCCTGDTSCFDSDTGLCCPRGSGPLCGGACCPASYTCLSGVCCPPNSGPLCGGACCPAGNTCINGVCCPPNSGPLCNGNCCPAANSCVNGCCLTNPIASVGSSTNYLLNSNCNNIQDLNVGLAASQDLLSANGWSLQLNAYNPAGPTTSWMQYLIQVSGNSMLASIQYWDIAAFSACTPCPGLPCKVNCTGPNVQLVNSNQSIPVPSSIVANTLPQGWTMGIVLLNDSIGNVTGATFTVTDPTAPDPYSTTINVLPIYQFPIVAIEANVVGYGTGAFANFTPGAGTITYEAGNQLCVEGGVPTACSSSAAVKKGTATAEMSNATYGTMSSCCGSALTQSLTT